MAGGAGGALSRYLVYLLVLRVSGTGLGAIFAVNISGSFVLGLLLALSSARLSLPPSLMLAITVGFLASYTTFSTLMWDTFRFSHDGSVAIAILNLSASIAIGIAAVALGYVIGRAV